MICHFFFGKVSLNINMLVTIIENMCQIISETSVIPPLRAKLFYPVWDESPCIVHIFVIEGLESVLNSVRNQVSSDE